MYILIKWRLFLVLNRLDYTSSKLVLQLKILGSKAYIQKLKIVQKYTIRRPIHFRVLYNGKAQPKDEFQVPKRKMHL